MSKTAKDASTGHDRELPSPSHRKNHQAAQKPLLPPEQLLAAIRAEAAWQGGSSMLGSITKRDIPISGETRHEAAKRRMRERWLEDDLSRENRRVYTGQVLPVFYD